MSATQPTTQTFSPSSLFRPVPQTPLHHFLRNPLTFVTKWLYNHQPPTRHHPRATPPIRLICISDTHNLTPTLPPGDILLHAGDLAQNGSFEELQSQLTWLNSLPHTSKIVVAGNHDLLLDTSFTNRTFVVETAKTKEDLDWGSVIYLEHACTTVEVRGRKVKVFGSPFTPRYGNWAFQYEAGRGGEVWKEGVPGDADVVVVHGPVLGHLDVAPPTYRHVGCGGLGDVVREVRPELFVCGHVHEARGREVVGWNGVQRMYTCALGMKGGAGVKEWLVIGMGVRAWMWLWVEWAIGRLRETQKTVFVNASTVGHWGVADGVVVEI